MEMVSSIVKDQLNRFIIEMGDSAMKKKIIISGIAAVLVIGSVVFCFAVKGDSTQPAEVAQTVTEAVATPTIEVTQETSEEVVEGSNIAEESPYWSFEDEDYAVKIDISGVNSNNWYRIESTDTSDGIYSYKISKYRDINGIDTFDFNADCKIYVLDYFDGFSESFKNRQDETWQYSELENLSQGVQNNRPYIWWKEWCNNQGTLSSSDYMYDIHYRIALNSNLGNENAKFLCIDLHMPIEGIYDNVEDYDVLTEIGNTILRDLEFDKRNEFQGVSDFDDDYDTETSQMILFDDRSMSDIYLVYDNLIKGSYIKDFHKVDVARDDVTICFTKEPFEDFNSLGIDSTSFKTSKFNALSYDYYIGGEYAVLISEPFADCYLVLTLESIRFVQDEDPSWLVEFMAERYLTGFRVYNGDGLIAEN